VRCRKFAIVAGPDAAVLDLHRELRHRLVGRCAQRAAVAQIETRAVQHAGDAAFGRIDFAGREFELVVGALVFDRVQLAVEIHDQDRDIVGPGHGFFPWQQLPGGADEDPVAHAAVSIRSFSRISKRRSSRFGSP
jgi:hypothetical protein